MERRQQVQVFVFVGAAVAVCAIFDAPWSLLILGVLLAAVVAMTAIGARSER